MSAQDDATPIDLTPQERDLVRREFMVRMGSAPSYRDGVLVRRWSTGANKGRPKPTAAVQSMLDRGLLALDDDGSHWLRAKFTPRGVAALRRMAADRRALPPRDYQHLLDELAADPG